MISNLSIHNYKSFHPTTPVTLGFGDQPAKPVFIYGLNGAGKSAIGEIIHRIDRRDGTVDHCQVVTHGEGPFRFLVYNHEFTDRILGQAGGMPGIFTLGERGTGAQKEMDAKQPEADRLAAVRESAAEAIKTAEAAIVSLRENAITQVWKAYSAHIDRPLGPLMQGYGRARERFFNDLRRHAVADDVTLDSMEDLERRWAEVSGSVEQKSLAQVDFSGLGVIEADAIWSGPIAVSGRSRLAPLIAQLENSDWVGAGRRYIRTNDCPFCQQPLPPDFQTELTRLLDGERQSQLDRVVDLAARYERMIAAVEARMAVVCADSFAEQASGLLLEWERCGSRMRRNASAMREKADKPSEPADIAVVDCTALVELLSSFNERVRDFNRRMADRESERAAIKTQFWQNLCRDRMEAYQAYDAAVAPHSDVMQAEQARDRVAAEALAVIEARFTELRLDQSGIDASIDAINRRLLNIGIGSFSIQRHEGPGALYRLARPGAAQAEMKSLSEGEKTLISFLYYIELLRGAEQADGVGPIGKTVAVIDDPISSLSVNYVFDIASLIHHELVKHEEGVSKVRQVIVLTHNLFFLHELLRQMSPDLTKVGNKCTLLRVVKNIHSNVSPLAPDELLNDYDALWHVLRDAREGRVPPLIVPNTMRCILEHFFAFTHREPKFKDALDKLGRADRKFVALGRFLDRGSHRDGINLTVMDYAQYDVGYCLDRFREVFREAGFIDHYTIRMGEVQGDEEAGMVDPGAEAR